MTEAKKHHGCCSAPVVSSLPPVLCLTPGRAAFPQIRDLGLCLDNILGSPAAYLGANTPPNSWELDVALSSKDLGVKSEQLLQMPSGQSL